MPLRRAEGRTGQRALRSGWGLSTLVPVRTRRGQRERPARRVENAPPRWPRGCAAPYTALMFGGGDTSREALRAQFAALRRLTPVQRLVAVCRDRDNVRATVRLDHRDDGIPRSLRGRCPRPEVIRQREREDADGDV